MFKPLQFCASVLALLSSIVMSTAPSLAQVGPTDATKLVFYNGSNADVTVLVSVPNFCAVPVACNQQDGCPTGSIKTLNWIDLSEGNTPKPFTQFTAPVKGWFLLKRGHRVQVLNVGKNQYTGLPSSCLQGLNFGFGSFSANCPDSTAAPPITTVANWTTVPDIRPGANFNNPIHQPLPNGSTGFEPTFNPPGTVKGKSFFPNPGCKYTFNSCTPGPTCFDGYQQDCSIGSTPNCVPTACPPYVNVGAAQEACDITCVNGANCVLSVQITPPAAGPYWTSKGSTVQYKTTVAFQNSWVDVKNKCDNNCVDPRTGLARPGVFPYGCTQCNKPNDPKAPCDGAGLANAQFCAARNNLPINNGCLFARSPRIGGSQTFGGTVQVTYLGPIAPPGTCPPGSKY